MGWRLIPEAREKLAEPQGNVLSTQEVLTKLRSVRGRVIIVGDYSAYTLLRADQSLNPHLVVYDLKTLRRPIDHVIKIFLGDFCKNRDFYEVRNPPGHISDEAYSIITSLMDDPSQGGCLYVDGEEDLLALVCILNAHDGDVVLYGQPKKGIVFIEVNKTSRTHAGSILNECFR